MPRSNRPRRRRGSNATPEPAGLDLERTRAGLPQRQSAPDGVWSVRPITALNAGKDYRCPGCHGIIRPGIAHLVVWQEDSLLGAETALADRRHWHIRCWASRSFR